MRYRNIKQVLQAFKAVHRARKRVFEGDIRALEAGRIKINEEFKKYKHVSDESVIGEVSISWYNISWLYCLQNFQLVKLAREVEKELKTNVIQAEQVEPGKYSMYLHLILLIIYTYSTITFRSKNTS